MQGEEDEDMMVWGEWDVDKGGVWEDGGNAKVYMTNFKRVVKIQWPLTSNPPSETTRQFEIAFRVFDADSSGYISVSEFRKVGDLFILTMEKINMPACSLVQVEDAITRGTVSLLFN